MSEPDDLKSSSNCPGWKLRPRYPPGRFILFLDDDILMHQGAIEDLVRPLLADSGIFMSTGYPFDIPAKGAGLVSYSILVRAAQAEQSQRDRS